jgi:hypothetical protein
VASGINWKGVAFWIALIVIAALVLCFVFNWFHIRETVTRLTSGFALPNLNLTGVTDWIKQNGVIAGAMASLGTTAVAYFIKNYQTNKLLNSAEDELAITKSKLSSASQKALGAEDLQKQLDDLNGDTTLADLQKSLFDKDAVVSKLTDKIATLQEVNNKLMDELKLKPQTIIKEVVK